MNLEIEDQNSNNHLEKKLEVSPLEEWAIDSVLNNDDSLDLFSHTSQDMLRVAKRIKYDDEIIEKTFLHGNCIPGKRRVYLTVDGEFKVCERVGELPTLGNVEEGYDFDKIHKIYFSDYAKYFEEICKYCWAQPMCSICYENSMGNNGIINGIENKLCDGSRKIVKDSLKNYYGALETDREKMESLIKLYDLKIEETEGYRKYEI